MARHHEAVAWRWPAARSCWAACFLIDLRCALWASPPSITAFGLPALSCSQCARRWCAPHRCRGVTSPVLRKCWSVRCGADRVSARLRIVLEQPSPAARPGSRSVRGSCGTRPLRPHASLLHNAALPSVPDSRCAKAPLGAGHRFAPCRVKATGVMQSGLR